MSKRTNPFEELEEFFVRMSGQFEDITGSKAPVVPGFGPGDAVAVDLIERDGEYEATVDLPGFEPDDLEVEVTDKTVQITAETEETREESEDTYLRRERHSESLHRTIQLPVAVDRDAVSAAMENGVLTVILPKVTDSGTPVEIE